MFTVPQIPFEMKHIEKLKKHNSSLNWGEDKRNSSPSLGRQSPFRLSSVRVSSQGWKIPKAISIHLPNQIRVGVGRRESRGGRGGTPGEPDKRQRKKSLIAISYIIIGDSRGILSGRGHCTVDPLFTTSVCAVPCRGRSSVVLDGFTISDSRSLTRKTHKNPKTF